MADLKEVALSSSSGPVISQEILPVAERIALLYQLSYVCLANFPNLETQVHNRALETKELFSSSKDLLHECVHTTDTMRSLFPLLRAAVENNKSMQLSQYLRRAKALIPELSNKLKELLNRFDSHNKNVAATTSKVCTERSELKKKNLHSRNCSSATTDHLDEVCICLSRVQKDLIELQKFWEHFHSMQEYLQNMTFVGEDLTEHLKSFKCIFLESITGAEEVWTKFGDSCMTIQRVFRDQAKDAYKFLRMKPSSLSEQEWEKQYNSVRAEILIKTIIPHFRDSVFSSNSLHDTLLSINSDHLFHDYPVCSSIREHMNQAKQKMENSEQTVREILSHLNGDIKKLADQQKTLDKQQMDKELELDNLQTQQASNKQSLDSYEDSLALANARLQSTQATLRRQQDREDTAKTVTYIGAGVTLIPFVGWIAGPAMMVAGAVEICEAEKAIKDARQEVERFQSHVSNYNDRVSECESKISRMECEIRQTAEELNQIRGRIQEMKRQREALISFLQKIRTAL